MKVPTKEELKKFYEENKKTVWLITGATVAGLAGLGFGMAAIKNKNDFIKNFCKPGMDLRVIPEDADAKIIDEAVFTSIAPQIENAIIDGESIVLEYRFRNLANTCDKYVKITVDVAEEF